MLGRSANLSTAMIAAAFGLQPIVRSRYQGRSRTCKSLYTSKRVTKEQRRKRRAMQRASRRANRA